MRGVIFGIQDVKGLGSVGGWKGAGRVEENQN